MAVIDMKRVTLIGMQRDKARVLKSIQTMGNLEISEFEENEDNSSEASSLELNRDGDLKALETLEDQLSGVEFALALINKYNPIKRGLFDMKPQIEGGTLSDVLASKDEIFKVVDEFKSLEGELSDITLRETRLENTIAQMEPWEALDIPLEDIKDTKTSRTFLGTVNRSAAERFKEALNAIEDGLFWFQELGETNEDACFFVVYHVSEDSRIDEIFKEYAFSRAAFAGLSGTPIKIIENSKIGLKEAQGAREDIAGRISEFSNSRPALELLYDALSVEYDRVKALQNLTRTDRTFILSGWVPAREAQSFQETLREEIGDIYIELRDPAPDEDFPVALDNPKVVTPFEMVTDLYSTPNSRELDPNGVMAPFYAIFFGIMMGDAGYGIIMALLTYYFIKKTNPKGDTRKLAGVIFIGGISTFIWGAIFGGWFGNAGALFGISPIWFNPSDEPIKMLIVCFAMGVVHVFAGMGVKAYINIKEGHILAAIFDQGLWYVFYIGLILWLTGSLAHLGPGLIKVGKIMTIAGAIGLVLTQGREKDNIFAKFFSGLLSLYDVTGFLSDILSYSRLFALALTTGVIGTVINQLGAMLGTTWYGWIIAAIILIGGHGFNIVINVLGAFVHSSRLQYIEFYGKFYEGGGKSFKPLGIRTKYTEIKN